MNTDTRLTLREFYEPDIRRYQDAMEASGLGRDWRDLIYLHRLLDGGDVEGFQFALACRYRELIWAVCLDYPEGNPANEALVERLLTGELSWDAVDYINPLNLKELENVALSETKR